MRPAPRASSVVTAVLVVVGLGAVACLGGCGGDNLYYQTRYIPTSSEESFSASSRWFRTEDKEVYELPSNPPALASVEGQDDHRQRVDCKPPGPAFKPEPVATYGKALPDGRGRVDGTEMATLGQPSGIPPAPRRRNPGDLGGWGEDHRYGPNDARPVRVVAQTDKDPQPPRYADGSVPIKPMSATGTEDNWCPPKP